MIDFDKDSNYMYVEDDNGMYVEDIHDITNEQYFDKIVPTNEVDEECISYTSFMVICGYLFNSLKGNSYLTKYVVGLILEVNEIITSKKEKISIERLTKQTNRFKTMFTTLKKKSIFN